MKADAEINISVLCCFVLFFFLSLTVHVNTFRWRWFILSQYPAVLEDYSKIQSEFWCWMITWWFCTFNPVTAIALFFVHMAENVLTIIKWLLLINLFHFRYGPVRWSLWCLQLERQNSSKGRCTKFNIVLIVCSSTKIGNINVEVGVLWYLILFYCPSIYGVLLVRLRRTQQVIYGPFLCVSHPKQKSQK